MAWTRNRPSGLVYRDAAQSWAHRHPASDTVWEIAPQLAAEHIDTIAGRVESVLQELAALPAGADEA